jgi:hypothetical protein
MEGQGGRSEAIEAVEAGDDDFGLVNGWTQYV